MKSIKNDIDNIVLSTLNTVAGDFLVDQWHLIREKIVYEVNDQICFHIYDEKELPK